MNVEKIVNLTPHPITLQNSEGDRFVFPSVGCARVYTTPGGLAETYTSAIGFPVYKSTKYWEVIDLPENDHSGVIYVVSAVVGAALRANGIARPDVLCPGTGPNDVAIRDEKGHIIAVTRLVWY